VGGDGGRGAASIEVSNRPALTSLDIRLCSKVTAAGMQALRSTTISPQTCTAIEF
jgi:hypothetical protein